MRKLSLTVLGLALLALVSASFGVRPSNAAQATMAATMASTKAMSGKAYHVAFVPPALTSPFHGAMVQAMKDETAKAGWTLEVQTPPKEDDYAGFVTIVQQLLEKNLDAISINPIDTNSAITAVKAANAKNVPIIAHNFITPFKEGNVVTYIGYDQWGGAEKLGQYTCQLLAKKYSTTADKAKGKVFILEGLDSIFSHRRTQGYRAGLAMCPAVTVVGSTTAEWRRDKGAEVATAALQKDPDIDVFYGNSDEMNIGAAQAATQLGKKIGTDFFSIGIDGNPPTLDLIEKGQVTATLGVDPYRMGVTVFQTMQKILSGEKVDPILLTPSVVVDASNIADYRAGKLWTNAVGGSAEQDNGKPTVDKSGMTATMSATMSATMMATAAK